MVVRFVVAVATFALSSAAFAQSAATPPARAPLVPHACKKPGDFPGRLASDNNRRNWVKEANDYLGCLKKYAMEHQGIAQPLFEQAKPHADAANAAIDEHNKSAQQFKEAQEKGS